MIPDTSNGRPELVRQAHGGALYKGGVKGNAGNRIRRRLQNQALHLVADRIPLLGHIADGSVVEWSEDEKGRRVPTLSSPTAGERTQAIKLLWEISNARRRISLPEVRKRLAAQVAVIREQLSPEQADILLNRLAEVWK